MPRTPDPLPEILARYGLDGAPTTPIASDEAVLYRVSGPGGDLFLRIGKASAVDLEAEVGWLDHLASAPGLRVPRVIRDARDRGFGRHPEGWSWVLFEWLAGESGSKLLDAGNVRRMGTAIGALHAAGASFDPGGGFGRRWDTSSLFGEGSWLVDGRAPTELSREQADVLEAACERCRRELAEIEAGEPAVFIHSDPHPGNMLITRERVALVDFAECGYGHPAFDLATLLHEFMDHPQDYERLAAAACEGYAELRPLPDAHVLEPQMAARTLSHFYWEGHKSQERRARFLATRWIPDLFAQLRSYADHGRVRPASTFDT